IATFHTSGSPWPYMARFINNRNKIQEGVVCLAIGITPLFQRSSSDILPYCTLAHARAMLLALLFPVQRV
ncbi:MAG: hypothetical protein DRO98_04235, partial [Archaeoglobales archaeon]